MTAMADRAVPIAGAAVLVALAALLWSVTREEADVPPDANDVAAPSGIEKGPPAAAIDASIEAIRTDADEAASNATTSGEGEAGALPEATVSPFAPTDDAAVTPAPSTTADLSDAAPAADQEVTTAGEAEPVRASGGVVVPSSYPISDAAKYYVPPDERGPGNLGGPPPLDFPGGPNDPNRADGGLAPPPAPGR